MPENGRTRVVVTGIGCVTPIGTGREGLWEGLHRGRSAVRGITRFDASPFRTRIAAEIDGFDPADWIEARRLRRLDRYSALAVAAASMALEDGRLDPGSMVADRTAVQLGSALGGVEFAEAQHEAYLAEGVRGVDPMLALTVFGGAASCNVAIEFGFTGPNATNAMSCASGAIGVGRGFRLVRSGEADVALAGGAEAPLSPLSFGAFAILRAMSTRNDDPASASRPFDRDRDGFVMGEGASILVLEELGHALRRDAPIYAEVCGFGTTNDAYHMTRPRPDGAQAARAMRLALEDAGVGPSAVDHINAHGSSTQLNDPTEAGAIRHVHGERAHRIPISGTKGYYGHALGASGAIEAAIVSLALRHDWLPPTLNLASADDACADLELVDGSGRDYQAGYVLSNSFGFGGINAALLFRRWEG
ncbi:MAG TPA: beta-ketoacyl-ACP synthase II [Gemmatimonadota bacterium]|nr:beta-ketoacyl-ACP synthase II [Gemmatimonadota bacterium]